MKLISKINNIKEKISGKITFDEILSKHSWFNLGGPAKIIYRPDNLNELSFFLKEIKGLGEIRVIGAGSNTLFRDAGFDGVIIKLGKSFNHISLLNEDTLIAGSSVLDKNLSNFALENSISGFEFLSCIPGSVGGAIRMNSGCYENEVSKVLISVQTINLDGKTQIIKGTDINFFYRGNSLSRDLIFISATFKGVVNKKKDIENKISNYVNRKKDSQPQNIKTCGSTFKNPENNKAWKLIKESGCAGMQIGQAAISTQHSNFFVNKGNANSNDLEKLIHEVQKKVLLEKGIKLELELQIVGKKV